MWTEQFLAMDDFADRLGDLAPEDFLSPAEILRLTELRSPRRRLHWLAGRWLAKELIRGLTNAPRPQPSRWHIESRDGRGRPTRPRLFDNGHLLPWNLSISHSARSVYVAISVDERVRLGVDVTERQHLSEAFSRLWLAPAEQNWCNRDNADLLRCIVWSVKESCYKATRDDRPFRPRQVDCLATTCLGRVSPEEFAREGYNRHAVADDTCTVVCHKVNGEIATAVALHPTKKSPRDVCSYRRRGDVREQPPWSATPGPGALPSMPRIVPELPLGIS